MNKKHEIRDFSTPRRSLRLRRAGNHIADNKELDVNVNSTLHSTPTTNPNNTAQIYPEFYPKIELHEGGGGYRKGVYRSAKDCLMRRKFNDTNLSLRSDRIALCPICLKTLKQLID